jgi:hypothetical protein
MGSKLLKKLKKDAEQARIDKENQGGDYVKTDWFKPAKGDNIIRILPHWDDPDEVMYLPVKLHFGVPIEGNDGKTYNISARCLKDLDDGDCPLCNAYTEMVKEDKEKAKELRVTERFLYNIMNYKERKVQVWLCPITVHREILYWINELNQDPSDPDTGRNWKITKEVDPKKQPMYGTKYRVRPDLKETKLPTKLRALSEELIDLSELYTEDHSEQMYDMLGEAPPEKKKKKSKKSKSNGKTDHGEEEEEGPEGIDPDEEMPTFEDEGGEEEAEEKPKKKKGFSRKSKNKKAKKTKAAEEEEDEGMEVEDADLDAELRELGVDA